jgi:hypothetical protein
MLLLVLSVLPILLDTIQSPFLEATDRFLTFFHLWNRLPRHPSYRPPGPTAVPGNRDSSGSCFGNTSRPSKHSTRSATPFSTANSASRSSQRATPSARLPAPTVIIPTHHFIAGLSLSVVQRLVELHQGTVSVCSTLGAGGGVHSEAAGDARVARDGSPGAVSRARLY